MTAAGETRASPRPLLRPPGRAAAGGFAAAFAELPRRFLAHHPGYARIRPALLPMVIPRRTAEVMWDTTARCLATLGDAVAGAAADAAVLAELARELGYPVDEAAWLAAMATPENLRLAPMFTRADFVLGAGGPRLVELNAGPAVGGLGVLDRYADIAGDLLRGVTDTPVEFPRPARHWAAALRQAVGGAGQDPGGHPHVALVVTDEDADEAIPHDAAHYLTAEGIRAEVVTAGQLRFDRARVSTARGPLDLVYGGFTYTEAAAPGHRQVVERAMACHAAGGPAYLTAPVFTLLGHKGMLARLRPAVPQVAATWPASGRALRAARANRDGLILKPALGYGGQGVTLGPGCDRARWRTALAAAAASRRPHVLQEYVEPLAFDLPTPSGPASYEVGVGCLSVRGRFAGFLLRFVPAGTAAVANVTSGAVFAAAATPVTEAHRRAAPITTGGSR